jgi:hypothetical protein
MVLFEHHPAFFLAAFSQSPSNSLGFSHIDLDSTLGFPLDLVMYLLALPLQA